MASKRVLVDTNVALDWLWSDVARPLWESQDSGQTELCLAASVLDTIHYIIRRGMGHDSAKQAIQKCVDTLTILSIDLSVIQQALTLPGNDFEDNVLISCALAHTLDLIVRRDPAGFKDSPISAIDPRQISAALAQDEQGNQSG